MTKSILGMVGLLFVSMFGACSDERGNDADGTGGDAICVTCCEDGDCGPPPAPSTPPTFPRPGVETFSTIEMTPAGVEADLEDGAFCVNCYEEDPPQTGNSAFLAGHAWAWATGVAVPYFVGETGDPAYRFWGNSWPTDSQVCTKKIVCGGTSPKCHCVAKSQNVD